MNTNSQRPPVRVAIIGLGRSAFSEHYPVFRDHPALFTVVACCDILKERRDIVAADFPNCRMFRNYPDLLDERDIDLVDIVTPSNSHVKIALDALKKGFWTLLESPLAISDAEGQILRGAAIKAKNRLIVLQRGMFAPDYQLARKALADGRLGAIQQISVRREDFIRRDDWQTVKRLGGGAAYYAMPDLMLQALKLLPSPPVQMWSELKRIASLGDAEDYAHVELKTRTAISVSIEFNGGAVPGVRQPSFHIMGDRGTFTVMPGEGAGVMHVIDPKFSFPRRRSSVRTPPIVDMHEDVPVMDVPLELPKGTPPGPSAFWRHIYDTVRTAAPFPFSLDDSLEAIKFSHLMKKTSPFGK